jgi:Fe-S cluster assembly protein SufD
MGGAQAIWLRELRASASERFESMAWPTPEDEEWRRTDLAGFDLSSYLPGPARGSARAAARNPAQTSAVDGRGLGLSGSAGGGAAGLARFDESGCVEIALGEKWKALGLRLLSLEDLDDGEADVVQDLLFKALEDAQDKIAVWHFAELSQGAFLYVPPGVEVDEPIVIDFEAGGSERFEAPQVLIVLAEGARATAVIRLSESYPSRLLCNGRTDLLLGDASALRLFDSQALGLDSLHFHHVKASLGKDASLQRIEVELGARLAKTRIDCSLEGRGAEAELDGLYFCGPGQHADVGTIQRHLSAGATSRAYYKGAASGGGRAVFQGLIEVSEGASGTDAYLSNRNLLLGSAARADSIPTLKIGNNDVKCSHGSATGRLGEEELFYLRSRGFSEAEARELLVIGFFEEVLARAPEAFREDALSGIRLRLPEAV